MDTVEQKTWYHVAATYDGGKLKIYTDGKLLNETAGVSKIPDATTPLMFGIHGIAPGTKFVGLLDEIAIFNAALAEDEIGQIMLTDLATTFAVEPMGKAAIAWGGIKAK